MKKIILYLLLTLPVAFSNARPVSKSKVPVLVKYAFEKAYPEAEHIKWKKTKLNDYKVSFRVKENYLNVYYSEKGEFIESDITVEWPNIPFTGRMEIYHLSFTGHVKGALKIVNNKKEEYYLVGVRKGLKTHEILLDHEGNLLLPQM